MPSETARAAVEGLELGPFATNSYVVYAQGAGAGSECWIVDPSFEPGALIDQVRKRGLKPKAIVLTHAHVDHIAGVDEVLRAFGDLPVLIHDAERDWLGNPMKNLSVLSGMAITARGPTGSLHESEYLELGGMKWLILHTPGHSPGGVTLYHAPSKTAIVGDTLFAGSIGRSDFPGSDPRMLERSIRHKLYTLPDDTVIYPGHGPQSTIGEEKRSNPFVRG